MPGERNEDRKRTHLSLVTEGSAPAETASLPPLLPRIADGDEAAVREAVARYGALVWSLVRRWTPEHTDAEDAVQEVFVDLWRSAGRFDAARSTEPGCVAMVTRRRLIDRLRRRQRAIEFEPLTAAADQSDGEFEPDLDRDERVERRMRSFVRCRPRSDRCSSCRCSRGARTTRSPRPPAHRSGP